MVAGVQCFPKQRESPHHPYTSALENMAPIFLKRTLATVKSCGDTMQDEALWEAMLQEVEAGYLEGPFPGLDWLSGTSCVSVWYQCCCWLA